MPTTAHAVAANQAMTEYVAATAGARYLALIAELREVLATLYAGALLTGRSNGRPVIADLPGFPRLLDGQPDRLMVAVSASDLDDATRTLLELAEPATANVIPFKPK